MEFNRPHKQLPWRQPKVKTTSDWEVKNNRLWTTYNHARQQIWFTAGQQEEIRDIHAGGREKDTHTVMTWILVYRHLPNCYTRASDKEGQSSVSRNLKKRKLYREIDRKEAMNQCTQMKKIG